MIKAKGMTLLEVMVAMAILAISGVAVIKSAAENLNSVGYLRDKTFALWIAENQLAEYQLSQSWPANLNRKGELEYANQQWYWQLKGTATPDPNFIQLSVQVMQDPKDGRVLAELITYMGR